MLQTHRSIIFSNGRALGALLAMLASPALAQSTPPLEHPRMIERTVSVSATGRSSATLDMAHISTGVQAEAATAREAMAANTAAMSRLIDGLKLAGVESRDIQTTAININQRTNKLAVVNGYIAQNQVRITVRDLKKLGELLDTSLTLGANQMGGISFDVSKAETLRDDARKAAMTNARRRAELYAIAAGVTLGDVLSISEDAPGTQPRFAAGRSVAMAASAIPVEAGELELSATIHVTYGLK